MADKKTTEEVMAAMDASAALARKDLDCKAINKSPDAVKGIDNWMKKWYLSAGYKRLSQILIEVAD